jgi:CRISPR-associated protein Cmr5
MQTRDQRYATKVYEKVQVIRGEFPKSYRKYGAMSHKLPILIHTAGLAQALAYVESRKDTSKKAEEEDIYARFLKDLAETVGVAELSKQAREVELTHYMYLTEQVLAALLWYKRFAQSVLNVDVDESIEQEKV